MQTMKYTRINSVAGYNSAARARIMPKIDNPRCRWIIFQFHACAACGTDREFAVAPAVSARMIRAPRRKVR